MKKFHVFILSLVLLLGIISLSIGQRPTVMPFSPVTVDAIFNKEILVKGDAEFEENIMINDNKELRFKDNGNYVGFEAPALTADQIWVLPNADGSANQVLRTDGSGILSWASAAAGAGVMELDDTDASHILTFDWSENASANYTLDFKVNSASRTINLSTDLVLTATGAALIDDANTAAQRTTLGLGTSDTPQFVGISPLDGTDTHSITATQETGLGGRLTIGLDETARTLLICDIGDIAVDFGLAASSEPLLAIMDATGASRSHLTYFGMYFNDTAFGITSLNRTTDPLAFNAILDHPIDHMFAFTSSANRELTDTDASQAWLYLEPKINQTDTANYVGLLMDVTESSTGSGTNELMALRVATVDKFTVDNTGTIKTGVWEGTAIANTYVAGLDQNCLTTSDPTFDDATVDKIEANEAFTYDAVQTATGDGTTTIDWGLGNLFYFTFGAANETFTFTAPPGAARIVLWLKQDGVGSRTATWPATVHWPGDVAPTLSTGAADVDIVAFVWDGTNYFGLFNGDFY